MSRTLRFAQGRWERVVNSKCIGPFSKRQWLGVGGLLTAGTVLLCALDPRAHGSIVVAISGIFIAFYVYPWQKEVDRAVKTREEEREHYSIIMSAAASSLNAINALENAIRHRRHVAQIGSSDSQYVSENERVRRKEWLDSYARLHSIHRAFKIYAEPDVSNAVERFRVDLDQLKRSLDGPDFDQVKEGVRNSLDSMEECMRSRIRRKT